MIAGLAVFVSNDALVGSCTPNDQSVLDGQPTITISGSIQSAQSITETISDIFTDPGEYYVFTYANGDDIEIDFTWEDIEYGDCFFETEIQLLTASGNQANIETMSPWTLTQPVFERIENSIFSYNVVTPAIAHYSNVASADLLGQL